LLEFIKGGKPSLKTEPPLIIYNSEGKYMEEVRKLYDE
jgi:tRNA1(Val) A37 N6-methylase TrmN6